MSPAQLAVDALRVALENDQALDPAFKRAMELTTEDKQRRELGRVKPLLRELIDACIARDWSDAEQIAKEAASAINYRADVFERGDV